MDGIAEIGSKIYGRKTTMDACGQSAALSKTAGCRFDSCPTCHFQPHFMEIQRLRLRPLTAVVTAVRAAEPSWPGLSSALLLNLSPMKIGKPRPTGRPLWG